MDRFLSAIFNWGMRRLDGADAAERQRWVEGLFLPLRNESPDRVSPSIIEDELNSFAAFRSQL